MRHFYNRRSGRNFCELKSPSKSLDYSLRGQILGSDNETMCSACVKHAPKLTKKGK